MSCWMSLLRLLRRRFVLGLIFAFSLTYCALSLFHHERKSIVLERDGEDDDAFWQMQALNEDPAAERQALASLNGSSALVNVCRNSVQGKVLIVDERGLVCARQEVLPTGCCSAERKPAGTEKSEEGAPSVQMARERYSCETCSPQGCCAVYEYCVSCCLNPAKTAGKNQRVSEGDPEEGERGGGHANLNANTMRLRLRTLDPFQICLATCRTSSASVRHENTYKDPHSKHCYNTQKPNLNSLHQRHQRDLIGTSNNDDNNNNNNDNPAVVVAPSSAVSFLHPCILFHLASSRSREL